jgi:hypothetical protein
MRLSNRPTARSSSKSGLDAARGGLFRQRAIDAAKAADVFFLVSEISGTNILRERQSEIATALCGSRARGQNRDAADNGQFDIVHLNR